LDELLTMNKKERTRLEVLHQLEEKRLKQRKAAEILGGSERYIRRLLRTYCQEGERGLITKRLGVPSNNRLAPESVAKAGDLIYERCHDFGPTLAHEKLSEIHDLKISRESVRSLMAAEELWKPRKPKRPPVHQM